MLSPFVKIWDKKHGGAHTDLQLVPVIADVHSLQFCMRLFWSVLVNLLPIKMVINEKQRKTELTNN